MIGVAVESVKNEVLRLEQVGVAVPINIHGATVHLERFDLVAVELVGAGGSSACGSVCRTPPLGPDLVAWPCKLLVCVSNPTYVALGGFGL